MGLNKKLSQEYLLININKDIENNIEYKDQRLFVHLLELAMYYYSINEDKKAEKAMNYIFSVDKNNVEALQYQVYVLYKILVKDILNVSENDFKIRLNKIYSISDLIDKSDFIANQKYFSEANTESYLRHLKTLEFCVKEKNINIKKELLDIGNKINNMNIKFEEALVIFSNYYFQLNNQKKAKEIYNQIIILDSEITSLCQILLLFPKKDNFEKMVFLFRMEKEYPNNHDIQETMNLLENDF